METSSSLSSLIHFPDLCLQASFVGTANAGVSNSAISITKPVARWTLDTTLTYQPGLFSMRRERREVDEAASIKKKLDALPNDGTDAAMYESFQLYKLKEYSGAISNGFSYSLESQADASRRGLAISAHAFAPLA